MRKTLMTGLVVAAMAVAMTIPAQAQQTDTQNSNQTMMGRGYMMGPGMMGQGMMGQGMGGQGYMMGPGMMGPGYMMGPGMMMMGPGMMGQGMMGQGYMMGPGMMGPGMMYYYRQNMDLNLSTDDIEGILDQRLMFMGNPHIKVGKVARDGKDKIVATIVTTDKGGLVQQFSIDRHSGVWTPE